MGNWINFNDEPGGIDPDFFWYRLLSLLGAFEVHVMCLRGAEKGATYGGFSWGYEFRLKDDDIEDPTHDDYSFTSYSHPMTAPSQDFQRLVRDVLFPMVGSGW